MNKSVLIAVFVMVCICIDWLIHICTQYTYESLSLSVTITSLAVYCYFDFAKPVYSIFFLYCERNCFCLISQNIPDSIPSSISPKSKTSSNLPVSRELVRAASADCI